MAKKERKGIWIPQSILELELNGNDKILLAEIYSLCEREDGCYASNNHFTKLLGYKTTGAASKRITHLSKKGFITTKNVYDGKRCVGRNIYRNNMMNTLLGIVPIETYGIDSRNQEVVLNEPEGISVENTTNTFTNSGLTNTYTSTDTGEKLVEMKFQTTKNPAKQETEVISAYQFFKRQKEDSAAYLVGATEIGGQIFEFDSPVKFPVLINLIGTESFNQVKPQLLRFIEAKKWIK
jgi:hypothetical protein